MAALRSAGVSTTSAIIARRTMRGGIYVNHRRFLVPVAVANALVRWGIKPNKSAGCPCGLPKADARGHRRTRAAPGF